MILFADLKYVWSRKKKRGFKFRINFITLTLSSAQHHPDTYILHKMLFPFLKYLERKHRVTAYIWRAEIQGRRLRERKERCIHFHITLDKFVHYTHIRNKWNALQLAHGYREKGSDPNSTDVHSVREVGKIVSYMSKYISKKVKSEEEVVMCKIWGMSRNLSLMNCTVKEEETTDYFLNVDYFIDKFCTGKKITDHATIYFNRLTMSEKYPVAIGRKLRENYLLFKKGDYDNPKIFVD